MSVLVGAVLHVTRVTRGSVSMQAVAGQSIEALRAAVLRRAVSS